MYPEHPVIRPQAHLTPREARAFARTKQWMADSLGAMVRLGPNPRRHEVLAVLQRFHGKVEDIDFQAKHLAWSLEGVEWDRVEAYFAEH